MTLPGGKYKNIVLVGLIIGGFLLYMAITTFWVVGDISKNRSCVRTCDTPLTPKAKEAAQKETNTQSIPSSEKLK